MVASSLLFGRRRSFRWTLIGGVLFATLLDAGFGDDAPASSGGEAAGDLDPDVDGDDDLDDTSDILAEAAVEDFDLTMPEEDRKTRMEACFGFATARMEMRGEELQAAVKESMDRHGVSLEQAVNSIVFSWMMSCYMNSKPEDIRAAGKALSEAEESRLFTPNPKKQQVHQASQRQWELLQTVLMDQTKKKQQEQKDQRRAEQQSSANPEAVPPIQMAVAPTGQTGWLYVLVVFGMLFGLGGLGVARLIKSEKDEQSAKRKKKEEKDSKKGKKKA